MIIKKTAGLAFVITLAGLFFLPSTDTAAKQHNKPRLILQITVDQLRGDIPNRHYNQFGEGGFRYLMDSGTVFLDAHHGHANTETIVGHTDPGNRCRPG